jgi:hypothetical protein
VSNWLSCPFPTSLKRERRTIDTLPSLALQACEDGPVCRLSGFVCLQIDIAGHGKLTAAERMLGY